MGPLHRRGGGGPGFLPGRSARHGGQARHFEALLQQGPQARAANLCFKLRAKNSAEKGVRDGAEAQPIGRRTKREAPHRSVRLRQSPSVSHYGASPLTGG